MEYSDEKNLAVYFGNHNEQKTLTFALSTVGKKLRAIRKILEDLSIQTVDDFELLIVVQTNDPISISELQQLFSFWCRFFPILVFFSDSKGLLKSRNIALSNSRSNWALLCDDDCRYHPNSVSNILEEIKRNISAQIITFVSTNGANQPRNQKLIRRGRFRHNLYTAMSVSSIEILMSSYYVIAQSGKPFDERFGLGTSYNTGGENIMLTDAIRGNYEAVFVPTIIVSHPEASSGHSSQNLKQMAFAKGAMFKRIFGVGGLPITMFFFIKKILLRKEPGFTISNIVDGIRGFLVGPPR